jgi:hypothetical protein
MPGYIVRMELNKKLLINYARRVNKPAYDEGYLVKGALRGAVADDDNYRPRPYSIEPERGGHIPILGYCHRSAEEILERMKFGDPECTNIVAMNTVFSRPLPDEWPEHVGFSVRVYPYINSTVEVPRAREKPVQRRVPSPPAPMVIRREPERHSRDVDYFDYVAAKQPDISREEAYARWLKWAFACTAGHMDGRHDVESSLVETAAVENSGAEIIDAQMLDYGRIDSYRQERKVRMTSVRMAGVLRIVNQKTFGGFLTTGVGRQKFAGFGMLKVHPVPPQ